MAKERTETMNKAEYARVVQEVAGCTCNPRVVTQELDDKGSFVVTSEHGADCSVARNRKLWQHRIAGIVPADVDTDLVRRARTIASRKEQRLL